MNISTHLYELIKKTNFFYQNYKAKECKMYSNSYSLRFLIFDNMKCRITRIASALVLFRKHTDIFKCSSRYSMFQNTCACCQWADTFLTLKLTVVPLTWKCMRHKTLIYKTKKKKILQSVCDSRASTFNGLKYFLFFGIFFFLRGNFFPKNFTHFFSFFF